jgi:hypothetical protein
VRGAGIEPDVERVAHLVVLAGLVAEQFGRVELEPGVDAFLLDALRHGFQQFQRARMRLAGFLVQEEGNRHAPVALARDAPVGPVGDHRVQPRLAPVGVELGRLDGGQRLVAQRQTLLGLPGLAIHADEPLRGGAIDDRRLVPPAVHVAVGDLAAGEQAPTSASFSMMTALAFQTNMPPKKGRLSANTPSPCTGVRISSLCMPCFLQESKSSRP